jgi:hypothetical protein
MMCGRMRLELTECAKCLVRIKLMKKKKEEGDAI